MPLLDPSKAAGVDFAPAPALEPVESLTTGSLEAIQVSDELATLYLSAKKLLNNVITDPEVPANQRAQVMNTCLSALERITKTRTDLYNSERIRLIEQTLIRVLGEVDASIKEAFIEKYEDALDRG